MAQQGWDSHLPPATNSHRCYSGSPPSQGYGETLGSRHTHQDRKMLCFQRGNSFAVSFVISEKGGKECWDCALSSSFCMAKFPCDSGKFTTVCNGKFILSLHWSFCFWVWLLLSKHSASVQACHPLSFPGFFFKWTSVFRHYFLGKSSLMPEWIGQQLLTAITSKLRADSCSES